MPLVLAAGVGDIVLVLALLLFAWAAVWVFQKPLVALFSQVPVIGANIVDAVVKVTGTIARTADEWAKKAADPLVQLAQVPIKAVGDWIAMQTAAFEDIAAHVIAWINSTADSLAAQASRIATALGRIAALVDLVATARANIATLFSRVATIIGSTIPAAIASLRAFVLARLDAAVDSLEALAHSLVNAARAAAATALAAAVKSLVGALDALRSWTAQAIATAVRPISAQLDQLTRVFGQAIDGIRAELGNLARLLPLAALLPLVGTLVQVIPRFLRKERECWDPACSFLGSVTDGLGSVGQLLTGSALLALVAAAIADPEGTADTVASFEDELRPLASLVTEALAGRSL